MNFLNLTRHRTKIYLFVGGFLPMFMVGCASHDNHHGHILSDNQEQITPEFDIVHTKVFTEGDFVVFQQETHGQMGSQRPSPQGALAGAPVYSYVWPTSLNSKTLGFGPDQGILALAMTVHPDFDDTPLYDENGDGDLKNDGDEWHSHWVVLSQDDACGPGALKVKDIPEGYDQGLPETWPGLPLFIDSPGYAFSMADAELLVKVPKAVLGVQSSFNFDGVTAALRVNQQLHAPLLCVEEVFDVASGDLSLPGVSQ